VSIVLVPSDSICNTNNVVEMDQALPVRSRDARGIRAAQSDPDAIPYHTRYYRERGRPSMLEKAQGQQYLKTFAAAGQAGSCKSSDYCQ